MDVKPFLLAPALNAVIGQRLVRRICEKCKEERELSESERKRMLEIVPQAVVVADLKRYEGKGCAVCGDTGYRGRVCVNEILVIDDDVREAILEQLPASDIRKIAVRNGMTTMLVDGMSKVQEGVTTFEEVLRVISE